jgi:hypothetical protein
MLYRLTFNLTSDGYLRIAASAKEPPSLSAVHLNERVLAEVVRTAQIAPFQTLRLLEAAREARLQPGIDICCEAVELTEKQVDLLCLRPCSRVVA